ncbi:MAG: formylglycine-generating enzyme family protein [Paludibacteraceae bacterium]|nr:formylglycine-generating enzyme family protein [Paludibacteraceae bacterium]
MKRILFSLILAFACLSVFAQTEVKKVAILETVDKMGNVPYGILFQVRSSLTFAISSHAGYEGYDRVDMTAITGEQSFQRTGMVSDEQIKRVGEMTGAAYVLIAEAALYDDQNIIIAAKILDVETGGVMSSTPPAVAPKDPTKMAEACIRCSQTLVGGKMPTRTTTTTTDSQTGYVSQPAPAANQDFTETAWDINMKMIWVEGGDFLMGCTSEQGGDCGSDEQNVRRVTVDGFYIGMLEVTQSQWEKVVGTSIYQQWTKAGNSGSPTRGVGPDYPMYCVSWDEAMEFCRLLSNKTGRTYTLPTEAQWEYAARGGNKNEGAKYAGSNMIDAVAWYTDNSGSSTHIVGSKRANALGIYDMSGNVWEWCKDWYASSYVSYDTNNPVGPSSGSDRVYRGGSWYGSASDCRGADRGSDSPGNRYGNLGFRVVLLP